MTFTEAAILILKAEGKPLTWRKLAESAVRQELLTHVGTDPAETMRVRLADVVRRQGSDAPFVEGKGGTYSLREWKSSSPGPSSAAAAEIEAYRAAHVPPPVAAEPDEAGGRKRGPVEVRAAEGGRRKRGGRGRGSKAQGDVAAEAVGVDASGREPEVRKEPEAGQGTVASGPVVPAAEASASPPDGAPASAGAEASGRAGEGRKRRRRGRRGRGGAASGADAPVEAPPAARPIAAAERPARPPTPTPAPPAPSTAGTAPVSCDLARLADAVVRLLRGLPGRRPLRSSEILAMWSARGAPEARVPPAALAVALAEADASVHVAASLVGLSGGRWAPTEWAWGEETAALERKLGESVAQHRSALRRTILRRLGEMPLAAFQQIAVALLAAEGFREIRPLDEQPPAGGEGLLLRGRMPYGPAEISMIILVVRASSGKFVGEDQVAALRGRLPRTGACGGVIVTTGRVSDVARRDLVPPNAIPLLAIEHEDLAGRLLEHRIGVRIRNLEVPAPDPEVFGGPGDAERG